VFFRIKSTATLRKLMNAYCDRQSVDPSSIAFLFDGRRLRAEQTPQEVCFFHFIEGCICSWFEDHGVLIWSEVLSESSKPLSHGFESFIVGL